MTTRYFKVVNDLMLKAMSKHFDARAETQNKADKFAQKYNFKNACFYRSGMYGLTLAGFKCAKSEHRERDDSAEWIIPKDGYTRPKAKKGSHLYMGFKKLAKEVVIDGKELEDLFGFNELSYFPTRPGYKYNGKTNSLIFLMPETCDGVNGCVEITNIEYLEDAA